MSYILLEKAFPIVVFVTPYVTQILKLAFDPLIKDKPTHDNIIRLLTCIIAGLVGAISLYILGLHPKDNVDWAITIGTCAVYAGLGGLGAMSFYSMINGYLRQTPPVSKMNTGATKPSDDVTRQPY